jgi:glycosyltransferase involved in cell wall biosynthesis
MLRVAYIFQNIGTRFDSSRAEPLHTLFTLKGLQHRGHSVVLLALHGRAVICSGDLDAISSGRLTNQHLGRLGRSGTRWFKLCESAIRRGQRELGLPYLALFDSYRMYDAGCQNLKNVQLIHDRYNAPAMGGALVSKRLRVPYVLEVNADLLEQRALKGAPERGARRWLSLYASRLAFRTAARITCTSQAMRQQLTKKWGLDPDKVVVLPCAADVEMFASQYDQGRVRQSLGLTTEQVVVWVGGYFVWQDLDLLAESFSRIVRARPNTKLVVVGDGDRRAAFAQKVSDLGLQTSVIMTGHVHFRRVPELLSIADVAVAPAPEFNVGHPGTPMKVFEYMAAGKAIVASNLDYIAAVVTDRQTGRLVSPGDVDQFAEVVQTLLADPLERDRLGRNAQRQALRQHSWDAYAEQLEQIYLDVL